MVCVFLMAVSFTAMADPAVVIRDFSCGLLDGNGGAVGTTNTFAVVTDSETGAVMLRCQADVTPSSSGKAVQWNYDNTGLLCGVLVGVTSKWREVVSAQGNATLHCHLPE
jgi:hypothetical protein